MKCTTTDPRHARNVRPRDFAAQMDHAERAALAQALERENMAAIERAGIAERIRQARKEAGLSQPEMADALGVIARTYQNYESVKEPRTPWALMNDIAKVTGKTTEWLIHGDRATPDLLGIAEHDQVDSGFVEFRGHVAQILGELQALRAREQDMQTLIDRQNANLAAQTRILERMQHALGITPPAADAPRPPVRIPGASKPTVANPEPSSGTRRRGGSRGA
jgi:transcriptional regulator with XRE-family HTH domain